MKRFYNNTFNSLALKNALRVFALLCVLLGFSSSAWGQTYYLWQGTADNYSQMTTKTATTIENNICVWENITLEGNKDNFFYIATGTTESTILKREFEKGTVPNGVSFSTSSWSNGQYFKLWCSSNLTLTIICDLTNTKIKVTAVEKEIDYSKRTIYFKNTLGWAEVYAYMDIYWDSTSDGFDAGAGANGRHSAVMENTGCDNIWKAVFQTDIVGQVAFSKDNQSTNDNFDNTEVVARSDYSTNSPMFIPYAKNDNRQELETKNEHDGISTKYYNKGVWVTKPAPTATQIILDISRHTGWKTSDAFFEAILYNGSDVVNTYDLTQCPYDNNIYFTESGLALSNCTHVEIQRWGIKDEAETKWNTSGKLELSCDNNCVEISGWDNSAEITKYEGECADVKDLLLLSREANINTSNKTATLYGYLKFTDCDAQITEYGFYYCPSEGCIPTENSKVVLQAQHQGAGIERGTEFSAVLNYTEGVRYGYRSYAVVNGKVRLSKEVRYFGSSQCNPQPAGQPINVTVDGAQYGIDYADNCNLIYGNLQLALDNLESHEKEYIVDGNLQQPIEITVYQLNDKGTYTGKTKTVSGGTGGGTRSLNVNVIEDINKKNTLLSYNADNKLVIKAAEGHNPRIQHLLIRESRNIEIDGLNIISNPTNNGETEDTALEIDAGDCSDWVNVKYKFADANITIKNSMIGSNGFTGVHATGCSGINFENNTFNLIVNVPENKDDAEYGNIVGWGASAKFFACKNIKFVRNNFMGAHPTLVWLQQSSNALFYNNVFWNTNEFDGECVAVRLCNQWKHTGNLTENIAFFYNTFYLADNDANKKNYDFLRFKDDAGAITESTIYFQYNNCYSYDIDIPGKASSGNSFVNGHYCPNNYWSIKSDAKFDIKDCGDDTKNINVSKYVCETTASGPASLVIKEPADPTEDAGLKVGTPLELTYIKTAVGTDIDFTEDDLTDDRYNESIRKGNAWTLGAYEQSASNDVETIYWVGGVDNNWDNRNNWVRIDETGQERRLTCVDNLSPNLKIIIPKENSTKYPVSSTGKYFYPEIPADFDAGKRKTANGIPTGEQVTAGLGYSAEPTQYAKTIELEYGAALKGVHRLVDGETRRYDNAISHLTVGRDEWTLVGTIVKPSDGNGGYRFITSNDYFCNYTPQVYMHQAEIVQEGEFANATWGDTFADLDKGVEPTTVYAINVPDQYGKYKAPSRIYYKGLAGGTNEPDKLQDGVKPHSFGPFTGRFVNESSMPTYGTGENNLENLTSGTAYLFNNSYPCNIDPAQIEGGNVMCYDYDGRAFVSIDARAVESTLKPQHGFIFIPTSNGRLTINEKWLVDGETKSRSAQYEEPIISIQLDNAEYGLKGYSNLVVKRDEFLADNENSPLNVRKVIAPNENTPEIYAIAFDEELARICVNNMSKTIPLGIYLHKPMSVKFSKCYSKNILSAILVDTYTNKEYDLMDRSFTTETLASGNLDGRFFLNLTTLDEDYYVEDEEDDDNVSTDVEENTLDENAINIFVRESDNAIRVLTSGVELREIYVSDMSGRTMRYNVNGYSASIKLPVPNGVYLVQVIGDKLTRTEKVILK